MSVPSGRMLRVIEMLQSAPLRTVRELADGLGVDERTVRRYVRKLIDMDIPLESVRGRYGGYRLAAGYRLPPLILTDIEAVAVVLGLSRALDVSDDPDISERTVLAKIRRVLPAASEERFDRLLEAITFGRPSVLAAPDANVLLAIADAIGKNSPLELRYRSSKNELSKRTVHPYDLVSYSSRWYLIALDVLSDEERTFRADRVLTARPAQGYFTRPTRPDVVKRLVEGFASADYRWRAILRIQASEERIRAYLPSAIAVLKDLEGPVKPGEERWHHIEIHAERLDWLPAIISALGCPVIVEGPAELKALLLSNAKRMLSYIGNA
ncbi:YafY family protein [Arthrobacter sp. 18067]|uniref:helix-turn-helix transcriptional regulator n=1 Tax=Arthrobacter sp. 18067 TaxID=2681413 RepID=UPI0013590ABF|nr:WYL domain-containing protein [Arthrobacter sp. 18067]